MHVLQSSKHNRSIHIQNRLSRLTTNTIQKLTDSSGYIRERVSLNIDLFQCFEIEYYQADFVGHCDRVQDFSVYSNCLSSLAGF